MSRLHASAHPLDGKVALVTLSTHDWAEVVVRTLRSAGARVALATGSGSGSRPPDAAPGVIVLETGAQARPEVDRAVAETVSRLGRIDVLVNLPGTELFRPAFQVSDADLAALFEQNVASAYRWCRAAGAVMTGQKSGRIVTFISGLARRGLVNGSAYAMTQAALDAMTQSLALEWAASGIRVNGIGYGWTESVRRPLDEQQKDKLVRFLPLRRKGHPDDLMGLLVYLASDASDFVTGQTIFIDGGAMAHA